MFDTERKMSEEKKASFRYTEVVTLGEQLKELDAS